MLHLATISSHIVMQNVPSAILSTKHKAQYNLPRNFKVHALRESETFCLGLQIPKRIFLVTFLATRSKETKAD